MRRPRQFYFELDLRKMPRLTKKSKLASQESAADYDHTDLSQALEGYDTSLWAEQQRQLEHLPEAEHWGTGFQDALTAEELLNAYNASLRRAKKKPTGIYQQNSIDFNVFFDEWGNKHVVSRPTQEPTERISELVVSPEGACIRLAYERVSGPGQLLGDLFEEGLCLLDNSSGRFARWPGYELRQTSFQVIEGVLDEVVDAVMSYNPAEGDVVVEISSR